MKAENYADVEVLTRWFDNLSAWDPGGGVERVDVYAFDSSTEEVGIWRLIVQYFVHLRPRPIRECEAEV